MRAELRAVHPVSFKHIPAMLAFGVRNHKLFGFLLGIGNDLNPHGSFGGFNRRYFQHGNESRPLVFRAV